METHTHHYKDLSNDEIVELIKARKSFKLKGVHAFERKVALKFIEQTLKQENLKWRVYTKARKAVMAGAFFSPTFALGMLSAAAIGAHNLATWNPDYEIAKDPVNATLTVTCKL